MLASALRQATVAAGRRRATAAITQARTFADDKSKLPFGLGKVLVGEPDNLIPIDIERKSKEGHIPDFATPEIKKDLEELGLTGIEDLDEMEEKNMEGFNELGLVPPEGAGCFSSPILIPSRMDSRVVGYEDPSTHAMYWFTIHNDENTYFIKDLGLFFRMLHIPDETVGGHH
mmetsp:Transcript_12726/g.18575  ORF Transcript_12726/g.18575 Transcript_12726/m.18575 type:complete len:173 (-) Transcript_12726:169-687(-)